MRFSCHFIHSSPLPNFLKAKKTIFEAKDDELMQVLKEHGISEQAAKYATKTSGLCG